MRASTGNIFLPINSRSFCTSSNGRPTQPLITKFFNTSDQPHDDISENTQQMNKSNMSAVLSSSVPTYYNNVRCITNKHNVCMKIELSVYKVLCFTETWLSDTYSSHVCFPSNFVVYRCDRVDTLRRAGGVAILVHRSLDSAPITLNIANDPECEFLAIRVDVKPMPLIYYVCYLSVFEHQIAMKHFQRIKYIVENFVNHRIIVLGDFNLHDIIWATDDLNQNVFLPHTVTTSANNQRRSQYNENALDILQKFIELPLFQMSNFRNEAGNVLDLLFVSAPHEISLSKDQFNIIEQTQQDVHHVPFEINIDCSNDNSNNTDRITTYRYANGNYERLCQEIEAINFQHEFNTRDIDSAYKFFNDTMNTLIESNVPKSTFKLYSNKPKWWSPELQRLKNRRDKLYKRKIRGDMIAEYETVLREFNELNERRHGDYILRVQENVKSDPKQFWNFAKISGGSTTYPCQMYYNDNVSQSLNETVNLFADYFESIYVQDDQPWHFDEVYREPPNAIELNITLSDIEFAIDSIKWKSGAGPDGLSPYVIKKCVSSIVWPIWLLYQKSFELGRIPESLKTSRVVPVHKKGDKTDVKNYRVIAISSIVMKIHEIAMHHKLSQIVNPLLSNAQHGFRPGRSVVTNILNLSIIAHNAFEKSRQVDTFYGDFKTAFDAVWLRRLIGSKLPSFNIGFKTAKWLCEFVISRKNYVKIANVTSRTYMSPSGVPAGSTFGPLLFTIFINDIVESLQFVKPLLFADDIKISLEIRAINGNNNADLLQRDISNLMNWCNHNRLYFNLQKCAIFSIYRDNTQPIEFCYQMNQHIIERKDEIRDLGVLLDRRLTFGLHIEQITMKCRQLIGCIKRFSNGNFTKDTQRILYLARVRSRLEFASIIWNPYVELYIDDIESIQKQFVIYLLDNRRNATSYRLAPYEDRCKLVNLVNLELRRKVADAVFAFDIHSRNIDDESICSKFVRNNYSYPLRSSTVSLLVMPTHFIEYQLNQPIVRMIKLINDYKEIVNASSVKSEFRIKISKEFMNPTIITRHY